MKSLLLKDWYMTLKSGKSYLIVMLLFLFGAFFTPVEESGVFFLMPEYLASAMVNTLLQLDERDRWLEYSGSLPYRRSQLVTAKYLLGILYVTAVTVLLLTVKLVQMAVCGVFRPETLRFLAASALMTGLVLPAVTLPFTFWLGNAKGQVGSLVAILVTCTAVGGLIYATGAAAELSPWIAVAMPVAALALYGLSWRLSIALFRRRERSSTGG